MSVMRILFICLHPEGVGKNVTCGGCVFIGRIVFSEMSKIIKIKYRVSISKIQIDLLPL